jgi:hypothetical protein
MHSPFELQAGVLTQDTQQATFKSKNRSNGGFNGGFSYRWGHSAAHDLIPALAAVG